jgi:hypothetical protein
MSNLDKLLKAAEGMDWQQVVMNGGPPCFCVESNGLGQHRFCGRAERWEGHSLIRGRNPDHRYVSLRDLLVQSGKAMQQR